MHEHTITLSWDRVVVYALWALVVLLLSCAWFELGQGHASHHRALLVGMTGLALSAFAAVLHIKLYMLRVCALVRTVARMYGESDGTKVRSIQ